MFRSFQALCAVFASSCGASPPPENPPGPPGTWTCKQIIQSCDGMCRTGMCLQACSNQGSQEGGSLHAALIQCAAANRCYDDNCTRAVCPQQVDACLNEGVPVAQPARPPQQDTPPIVTPPPQHDEPPKPEAPAPTAADVTGEWTYGAKTAITAAHKSGTGNGGMIKLDGDGRFERATNLETTGKCKTETFAYVTGAWKLDGSTLILSVKQATAAFRDSCHKDKNFDREDTAKDEHRAIRIGPNELLITDDAGELQSYRKR